jgi:hypothetical protein
MRTRERVALVMLVIAGLTTTSVLTSTDSLVVAAIVLAATSGRLSAALGAVKRKGLLALGASTWWNGVAEHSGGGKALFGSTGDVTDNWLRVKGSHRIFTSSNHRGSEVRPRAGEESRWRGQGVQRRRDALAQLTLP